MKALPDQPLQRLTLATAALLLMASVAACADDATTQQPSSPPTSATIAPPTPTPSPTPTPAPTPSATPTKEVKYSINQLNDWYDTLRDPLYYLELVALSYVDKTAKQIVFYAYPLRDVRKSIEAEILKRNVPLDAVQIEIGCEDPDPPSIQSEATLDEPIFESIDYILEIPEEAAYGAPVQMRVTLKNISDEPGDLLLGGDPPQDFVISKPDGKGIWYWGCQRIRLSALVFHNLQPGEEIEFLGEWQQVNIWGEPVPPGVYIAQGLLEFGTIPVRTEPHRIKILPP